MKAAILTIGDEILIGQTINSNGAYIGQQLNQIGIEIEQVLTIKDVEKDIISAAENLFKIADLIIVTGGLGPTNDDITKETLTKLFDDELVLDRAVLEKIEKRFQKSAYEMLAVHSQQAMLPSRAKLLSNTLGTACGMWFEKDGKNLISLPGVPYEMEKLIDELLPLFKEKFDLNTYYQRTAHFQGIVESKLADENSDLEASLKSKGVGMAFLPSPGLVRIRLSGNSDLKEAIDTGIIQLHDKYPKECFGLDGATIAGAIGDLLRKKGETLGTVESCTAGSLSARICSVSGASKYFIGSIITYKDHIKIEQAGVPVEMIETHGEVSQEVAEAMAIGGRDRLKTDYTISTTGIAGPDGGTVEKPVGTVWIAVSADSGVYSKKFHFRHNRERNIESTVVFGLNYLRRVILGFENTS